MVPIHFSWKRIGLVFLDLLIINFSYLITMMFRLGYSIPDDNFQAYLSISPWIWAFSILFFFLFNLYGNWLQQGLIKVLNQIILSITLSSSLIMSSIYLTHNLAMPRTVTVINPALELILISTVRIIIWSVNRKIYGKKKVIILGHNEREVQAIAKSFLVPVEGMYSVCGQYSILNLNDIEPIISGVDFDAVAMRSELAHQDNVINLCIKENKEILVVPDIYSIMLNSAETHTVEDRLFFSLKPPGISDAKSVNKRVFDIICSIIGLILLSPVFLLVTVLIRLTSPGSAFYRQERLGEEGKPFQLLKFRSMISNAEDQTGPVLTTVKDPRITRFGTFLRASRLDEIPQLINVLKGDMSLVGPRPERDFFIKQFSETIPYYNYRMAVKPGITGLAQVMGKYNTSPEDKLQFDLIYIRNYSLLFDLKILLLTVRVIFQKEKASGVEINFNETVKKLVS